MAYVERDEAKTWQDFLEGSDATEEMDWLKSRRENSILEPEDKGDLNTELKHVSNNLQEQSLQVNNYLNGLDLPESKWSGKTIIKSDEEMGLSVGKKKASCDIWLREDAPIKTVIHEHLHARSSSRFLENFSKNRGFEEGACELFAQEICRENGISFRGSYKEYVNSLREFRKISKSYDNDYDFAYNLFKVDMNKREKWLSDLANQSGIFTRRQLKKLINKMRDGDE